MNDRLLKNNLLIGMHWEPASMAELEPGLLNSFRNMIKSQRRLLYTDSLGQVAVGYTSRLSSRFEAFPIYLKELYGDGIYFRHQANNNGDSYLVIIKEGRVLAGTDCFLKRTLFDVLLHNADVSKSLANVLITDNHIATIIENNVLQQQQVSRRHRFFIISFMCAGALAVAVLAVIFHLMKAG